MTSWEQMVLTSLMGSKRGIFLTGKRTPKRGSPGSQKSSPWSGKFLQVNRRK